MRKIKKITFVILFFHTFTLTGCWNNTDLTKLAIATAVGIDKLEDDKFLVSVQIVKTSALASSQTGNGGGQGQGYFVISRKGATIFEAIRAILNSVGRKVFYTNVQAIIIDEAIAKSGIGDVIDFFERQHEPQLKTVLLISKGTSAKEILETKSNVESFSAINIAQVVQNSQYRLTIQKTLLIDFLKNIRGQGEEPVIGMINKPNPEETKIEGTAVFKKDKMVGMLTPYETLGFELSSGKASSGIITIQNPCDKEKKIVIEIKKTKRQLRVNWEDSTPSFMIKVEQTAEIAEVQGIDCPPSDKSNEKLERTYTEEIRKRIRIAVEAAQQRTESDIFGFGRYIHKHNPKYWNKVKDNWNNEFCNAKIELEVKVKIIRTGQISHKKQ